MTTFLYGVRPKTIWTGEGTAKGHVLEEMLDAFRRSVPRSEVDALRVQTKAEEEAEAREETAGEDV